MTASSLPKRRNRLRGPAGLQSPKEPLQELDSNPAVAFFRGTHSKAVLSANTSQEVHPLPGVTSLNCFVRPPPVGHYRLGCSVEHSLATGGY